jgi:predicted Zn-dependent protease
LHSLARAHARVGDFAESRQLLQVLLSIRPGHVSAIILGLLMSAADGGGAGFFEARAHAALDSRTGDKDEAALMAAALALIATVSKDDGDAAALWERASTLSAAQPFSLWQVARMRLAHGDVDKAVDMLARLTEKNMFDVAYHRDAARAGAVAALGPDFIKRVQADFKARSSWPTVRLPLGTIHVHPGAVVPWETSLDARWFPEAELAAAVEGVRDLSPRVQVSRIKVAGALARAQALLSTGNARGARDLLKETLVDNKNDADLLHLLARASATLGERADAERFAREALELNPQDPRVHLLLASVLLDASDANGALKELAVLEDAGVESARGHALKARALTLKGKGSEAQKELARAQVLDGAAADAADNSGSPDARKKRRGR